MGTQYVGNLLIQIERWRWRHRGGKVMRAQKDSEGRRLITGCAHKGSLVIHLDKDHTSGAAREVFAVLRIYFFTLHGNVCQFHLTFLYDAPLYFYQTDSDEMTVYPCRSLTSLVPQPTCCWKWVGGTKGLKRAFLSLTAIFSAGNGSKL